MTNTFIKSKCRHHIAAVFYAVVIASVAHTVFNRLMQCVVAFLVLCIHASAVPALWFHQNEFRAADYVVT